MSTKYDLMNPDARQRVSRMAQDRLAWVGQWIGDIPRCLGALIEAMQAIDDLHANVERLRADALRWKHVASLAHITSLHMGGEHSWRFEPVRYGRGPTIEAAVDAEIEHDKAAKE